MFTILIQIFNMNESSKGIWLTRQIQDRKFFQQRQTFRWDPCQFVVGEVELPKGPFKPIEGHGWNTAHIIVTHFQLPHAWKQERFKSYSSLCSNPMSCIKSFNSRLYGHGLLHFWRRILILTISMKIYEDFIRKFKKYFNILEYMELQEIGMFLYK